MPRSTSAIVLFGFILFLVYVTLDAPPSPGLPGTVPQVMTITITSPAAKQIYQRNDAGQASIPIAGTYTGSPVTISAVFNDGTPQVIDATPSGGAFSGTLTLQDAGQGDLEVYFTDTPATTDTVANIGIGDVFMVAGQSNANGFADNNQSWSSATLTPVMWKLASSSWATLADPSGNSGAQGSVWPLLATRFMNDQDVPVGFITTAWNGTGLVSTGEWAQGGARYEAAIDAVNASGVNAVKAILWYQGEQDINDGVAQTVYQAALSQMLDDMQADCPALAHADLVAAQIGYKTTSSSTRVEIDPIRLAIANRWSNDPDILAGPVLYDVGPHDDGVHFGSGGNDADVQTLANRWWRMLSYHYYDGTQGRAPRFVGATREGTAITVSFTAGVSPLVGQTDTTGWRVTDNGAVVSISSVAADGPRGVIVTLSSEPTGLVLISFGSGNDGAGSTLKDSGTYPLPPEPFTDQSTLGAPGADLDSAYDPAFAFYVDVESKGGARLGTGPLKALNWRYESRFDRTGTFSCTFLAGDAQAQYVTNRRYLRAWALLNGVWTEVGYGRVDHIEVSVQDRSTITASGMDVITELGDLTVGDLEIGRASEDEIPAAGATHAEALEAIAAYAPSSWIFTPAESPANDYLYALFAGESALGALIHLAERTQTHFYRGTGRELIFASEFTPSGIHAIRARGQLAAQTCAISLLSYSVDTHDYVSRAYGTGSGTGRARLTMRASDRTAPDGYTFNKTLNYIQNDDAWADDPKDFPAFEFKEITPIDNTDADLRAAANMLFDATLAELVRRSSLASQYTYELGVSGCSVLLRPLQTIRTTLFEPDEGIDLDDDLLILGATWEVDSNGARTSRLIVSTDDRWPESDIQAAAERAVQGRVFIAHPQVGPTSYWENSVLYVGSDQANHMAELPFFLRREVTQVTQIVLLYKTAQVLNFASIVAGKADFNISGLEVEIDNSSITMDIDIDGDITLDPHTHPVPNHDHHISVAGSSASTDHVVWASGGGFGFLQKVSSGTEYFNTDADTGATTSEGGGDGTFDFNALATGTGTGSGTGSGSGTVDLSDAITSTHGIFRAPASQTYALEDLELLVNSKGLDEDGDWTGVDWVSLDEGVPVEGGFYELDITGACVNAALDFRPSEAGGYNLIEIRRKSVSGEIDINEINGNGTIAAVNLDPFEYADFDFASGDQITISGTVNFNGTYIISVNPSFPLEVTIPHSHIGMESGVGVINQNKSVMIFAKLGVRVTIQSINFT